MTQKSLSSVSASAHETAEPVNSRYDQSSFISSAQIAGRLLSRESTSATSSANPSRESSPIRPVRSHSKAAYTIRSGSGSVASLNRLKNNNSQDTNSTRSTNPPSAAATQRALSAAPVSALHPLPPEQPLKPHPVQSSLANPEVRESPRWPISPRLRSPPPINPQPLVTPRNLDVELASKPLKKSCSNDEEDHVLIDSDSEEISSLSGMRTPARGVSGAGSTLETVQEISRPGSPVSCSDREIDNLETNFVKPIIDHESHDENGASGIINQKPNISSNESGNESSGKGEAKLRAICASLPGAIRPTGSQSKTFMSAGTGRGKSSGEGLSRNMTVETETVSSVSQISVGLGGSGNTGSIRTKPSCETIRPRKEKKKNIRKPPSITSGTASSKAEIFEAKVASAVDEANSSDSEETFVYESNPPDSNERPRRFHSRTPSAASVVSQADLRSGIRAMMDGQNCIVLKKSMKFANSYNSTGTDPVISDDVGKVTVRSNTVTGRGTTQYHHVNVRWGRHAGNGHQPLFDNESPFPNPSASKVSETGSRLSSRPNSPKTSNKTRVDPRRNNSGASGYGMDSTLDERTPLLTIRRASKTTHIRRHYGPLSRIEHQANKPLLSRCGGFFVLYVIMLLLVLGVAGFMFATTQPLVNVKILALNNILATEQILLFDMKVQASNPNLVAVTIESTDLFVFAKSKYPSNFPGYIHNFRFQKLRRGLRNRDHGANIQSTDETSRTNKNLELGHINTLENPMTFEGSPFSNSITTNVGQVSIISPGNETTPNDRDLWRKLLKHEFNLILRGRLKYTLPMNKKMKSISVEFRTLVTPNAVKKQTN